jgi:hypothetical protein
MLRVINRKKGFVILPSGVIVGSHKSVIIEDDELSQELLNMKKAKLITIHDLKEKNCCWTKFCIDPLCITKHNDSPDLVPIEEEDSEYGLLALSFKNGKDTELCFEIELPPNYIVNSDLKPIIDWKIVDSGNYGNVTWMIEFNALQDWILFKRETLTHNMVVPQEKGHVIVTLPKIPGGGFKYNTLIQGRLIRKGTQDTYNLPAVVPSFDIHYQVSKPRDKSDASIWRSL